MYTSGFAIIPDDAKEPSAVFLELEDAISWGLSRHGGNRFKIRHVSVLPVETDEVRGARAS